MRQLHEISHACGRVPHVLAYLGQQAYRPNLDAANLEYQSTVLIGWKS